MIGLPGFNYILRLDRADIFTVPGDGTNESGYIGTRNQAKMELGTFVRITLLAGMEKNRIFPAGIVYYHISYFLRRVLLQVFHLRRQVFLIISP